MRIVDEPLPVPQEETIQPKLHHIYNEQECEWPHNCNLSIKFSRSPHASVVLQQYLYLAAQILGLLCASTVRLKL